MRRFILFPGATFIACIGLSRIYLGMHWMSDIIGSVLLASCVLFLHVLSYQRSPFKAFNTKPLFLLSIVISFGLSGYFMLGTFERSIRASYLKQAHRILTLQEWWQGNGKLPHHRTNRFGKPVSTLNVQIALPISAIRSTFAKNGWIELNKIHLSKRLKNYLLAKEESVSLFQKLLHNKPPILVLIKGKHILRLWPSHVRFRHSKVPLWLGTLSTLKHEHVSILDLQKHQAEILKTDYHPQSVMAEELKNFKLKTIKEKTSQILLVK